MGRPSVGNSNEFADMWKQLQQHKNDMSDVNLALRPGLKSFDCSLLKAAQALGKLPNPSAGMSTHKELSKNNNCSNNRDHRSSSSSSSSSSSLSSVMAADPQTASVSNSGNMTRLNLDNLFEHAVKRDMKALTNSLEGVKAADSVQKTNSPQASRIASGSAEVSVYPKRKYRHRKKPKE